jgi:hypothetical protein
MTKVWNKWRLNVVLVSPDISYSNYQYSFHISYREILLVASILIPYLRVLSDPSRINNIFIQDTCFFLIYGIEGVVRVKRGVTDIRNQSSQRGASGRDNTLSLFTTYFIICLMDFLPLLALLWKFWIFQTSYFIFQNFKSLRISIRVSGMKLLCELWEPTASAITVWLWKVTICMFIGSFILKR